MKISYDYEDMMHEIEYDLAHGALILGETIQVQRADVPLLDGYRPIVDWFYSHATMMLDLAVDEEDDEQFKEDSVREVQRYLSLRPFLSPMKVRDVFAEMKARDDVL